MNQLWFLDLDGVKSGPYPTQEILTLVAEGEVLPHHRIALNINEGPWSSVLEWKLHQANLIAKPETVEEITKEVTHGMNMKPPVTPPKLPPSATPLPKKPLSNPFASNETTSTRIKVPRKDPMAELFDLLVKSKQKRDEKTIQAANASANNPKAAMRKETASGVGKTAAILFAMTVTGYVLGQWVRNFPTSSSKSTATTPTPRPAVAASPSPHEQDRSTDKITIRSKPKAAETPRRTPPPPTPPPVHNAAAAKDLKELQDLKKELQELKTLKEELKNSISDDEMNNPPNLQPDQNNNNGAYNGPNNGANNGQNGPAYQPNDSPYTDPNNPYYMGNQPGQPAIPQQPGGAYPGTPDYPNNPGVPPRDINNPDIHY